MGLATALERAGNENLKPMEQSKPISTEEARNALKFITTVGEIIQSAGAIPSGHLYAMLMDKISLETYDSMIQLLIRSNVVRQTNSHELVWTGSKGAR